MIREKKKNGKHSPTSLPRPSHQLIVQIIFDVLEIFFYNFF